MKDISIHRFIKEQVPPAVKGAFVHSLKKKCKETRQGTLLDDQILLEILKEVLNEYTNRKNDPG